MSTFDNLKKAVDDLREDCSDFTELDSSDFPSEKIGIHRIFTMQEATALFEEQLQTIESALEDEANCVRHVPESDMRSMTNNNLRPIKACVRNKDYKNFVKYTETMISDVRPFAILSMEKMDSKRYREIENLETVLRKIKEYSTSIVNIRRDAVQKKEQVENIYNNISSKLEILEKGVVENQKKSNTLSQLQESSEKHRQQIQTMHNDIQSKKSEFDQFSNLIQKRNENISAQEARTKHYEERLEEYEKERIKIIDVYDEEQRKSLQEYRQLINKMIDKRNMEQEELLHRSRELIEKMIDKHNTEQEELFHKSRELIDEMISTHNAKQKELLQKSHELISSAEEAAELKSAEGLSWAFGDKEKKIGRWWIKLIWMSAALSASASAIYLGWDTAKFYSGPNTTNDFLSLSSTPTGLGFFTIARVFLMLIAISVATFAARQYSKNKSIELDYAYKSAIVKSYPGLAKAFQDTDDDLRAKYAARLMEEVLQDPQRKRSKDGILRSSTKIIETEKARKIQKQAEPPVPPNNE